MAAGALPRMGYIPPKPPPQPWHPLIKPPEISVSAWKSALLELWGECPPPIGFYPKIDRWVQGIYQAKARRAAMERHLPECSSPIEISTIGGPIEYICGCAEGIGREAYV